MGWADVQVHRYCTDPSYQSCSWLASENHLLRFDKNINLKHGAKLAILFPISRFVGWMGWRMWRPHRDARNVGRPC